jgi:hypothetical protein
MNFQALASPMIWIHDDTSRYPVPDDDGFGITICPLYTGFARSCHDSGLGMFFFAASAVLKQMVAPHTSMPTHVGGFLGSRNCGADARETRGRVRQEHAFLVEDRHAGGREDPR